MAFPFWRCLVHKRLSVKKLRLCPLSIVLEVRHVATLVFPAFVSKKDYFSMAKCRFANH